MPFSIPTLADLRSQNRANFAARLPGAATWLRHAVIPILADLCAYPLYAAYRALVWISQQMFTDSAEAPYLDRMGADYGILRVSAVPAVLVATASFTQPATIPAGTAVSSSDFTQTYTVTTAITATGAGTLPVTVTGATPGAAANQADGAILILQVAIAGVQAQMTVTGTTTAGTDAESDASLRARIIARKSNPPQGGAGADFSEWARNSGIPTRAWVFPQNRGIGTCDVAFTVDTATPNIPTSPEIATVQTAISASAPVIGSYEVFAPIADPLTITLAQLSPNNATQQAAIVAALAALALSVPPGGAVYGDGVTEPLTNGAVFPLQTPGTLYLSQIEAVITAAGGVLAYDLVSPSADVAFATGHLPAAPNVVFQ